MRAAAVCLVLLSCGAADLSPTATHRQGLTEVTGFGTNPGGLSLYVHEPASTAGAPLVVVLHGCSQSASSYEPAGWNALADAHRFVVAYVEAPGVAACFSWSSASEQRRDGPEVTSILQMVQHLVSSRGLDASRVYVSGFSAGGAMANVLLAVAPDVFTRGQVIAGLPFACVTSSLFAYSCMTAPPNRTPAEWGALVPGRPAPRVQLWHGTSDFTVASTNLTEEVDQWTHVNGIDTVADEMSAVGVATRKRFNDAAGITRVESWLLSTTGHGTPVDVSNGCGAAGSYRQDVGICSAEEGARFFGLLDVEVDAGVADAGDLDAGHEVQDAGFTPTDAGVATDAGTPSTTPDAGQPPMEEVKVPTGCTTAPVPAALFVLVALVRRRRPRTR